MRDGCFGLQELISGEARAHRKGDYRKGDLPKRGLIYFVGWDRKIMKLSGTHHGFALGTNDCYWPIVLKNSVFSRAPRILAPSANYFLPHMGAQKCDCDFAVWSHQCAQAS